MSLKALCHKSAARRTRYFLIGFNAFALLGAIGPHSGVAQADTDKPSWTCADNSLWAIQETGMSQHDESSDYYLFAAGTNQIYTAGVLPPQRFIPLQPKNAVSPTSGEVSYPAIMFPEQEWSDYYAPYYSSYQRYMLNVLKPDPSVDLCGHTNISIVPGMVYASSAIKNVNGTFGYGTYNLADERLVAAKNTNGALTNDYGVSEGIIFQYLKGGVVEDEFGYGYDYLDQNGNSRPVPLNPNYQDRIYSNRLTGRYLTVKNLEEPGCTIVMSDEKGGSSTFSCEKRIQWSKSLLNTTGGGEFVSKDSELYNDPGNSVNTNAVNTYFFLTERVFPSGEKELRHYVNEANQPEDYLDSIYFTGPAPAGQAGAPERHISFTYDGLHRRARVKTMTFINDNTDVGPNTASATGSTAPASNAVTLTFDYDPTKQFLVKVSSTTGDTTSFSYDAKGRIDSVITPTGATDYNFYPTDQVSKLTGPVSINGTPLTQTFAYNYAGSEFDTTDPQGLTTAVPVLRASNNLNNLVTYYSNLEVIVPNYKPIQGPGSTKTEKWDNFGHKYILEFKGTPGLLIDAYHSTTDTIDLQEGYGWPNTLSLSKVQIDNDVETLSWDSPSTPRVDNFNRFSVNSIKVGKADGSSPMVEIYHAKTVPSASGALDFLHKTITDPVTGMLELQTFDESGWRTCDAILPPQGSTGPTFCENVTNQPGTYGSVTTCPSFPHPIAPGQTIGCTVQDFGVDPSGSLLPAKNYQVTFSQNYAGGRIAQVVTPSGTLNSDDLTSGGSQTITASFPNGSQLFSETMTSGLFGTDSDSLMPFGPGAGQATQLQASVMRYANGAIKSGTLPDGSQLNQTLDTATGIPNSLTVAGAFGVSQSVNMPLDGLGLPQTSTSTLGQSITETFGRNLAPYTSALPTGTTVLNLPQDTCDPASPDGRNGLGPAAKCGDDGNPYICGLKLQPKDSGETGKPWTTYDYIQIHMNNDNPNAYPARSSWLGVSQCFTKKVTIPTPFDGWVTINMPGYAIGVGALDPSRTNCCQVQCAQQTMPLPGCPAVVTGLSCVNDNMPAVCGTTSMQQCDTDSTVVAQACGGFGECPPPPPPPTDSPTPTPTDTSSPTPSPTDTSSPSPSPTDTSSPSPSPTDTSSPSPSPTDTSSPSPSPVDTSSPSPSPTNTSSPSPSPTDTSSPSPSPTDTSSPSPSPIPTCTGYPPALSPEETVGCCNGTYVTCLQPQFGGPAAGCCSLSSSSPSPSP